MSGGSSFPGLRIDQVLRPLAAQRGLEVIQRAFGHGAAGFEGGGADVRQGHGVGQGEQRRFGQRLLLVDIETGGENALTAFNGAPHNPGIM